MKKNPEFVEFLKNEPFNATENCRNSREKIKWNGNSRDETREHLDIVLFFGNSDKYAAPFQLTVKDCQMHV